jgi:hypothetical protein
MGSALIAKLFMPGMAAGLVSPFVAVTLAAILYVRRRPIPAIAYWFLVLGAGVVAGFFGLIEGAEFACNSGAGNLCGLFGVFATGPLSFAAAVMIVAAMLSFLARS